MYATAYSISVLCYEVSSVYRIPKDRFWKSDEILGYRIINNTLKEDVLLEFGMLRLFNNV